MKNFVWATDVHLDHLQTNDEVESFARSLTNSAVSGVFLTGDISMSALLPDHLRILDDVIGKPIYYVLGNHDIWNSSTEQVRKELSDLMVERPNLKYLTNMDYISVSDNTAIVGHDGWYDAMIGDPYSSPYFMNDWFKIRDFSDSAGARRVGMYGPRPNISVVVSIARKLADKAAQHVMRVASLAAENHDHVVVLTHIPPFEETHFHEGKKGSPMAMPWYTSKMMGDVLLELSKTNPSTRFDVFCGHTHSQCDVQISDNLFCHVGHAEYGNPAAQGLVQLP